MKKVLRVTDKEGQHQGWMIFCPGCESAHVLDSRWTFNGDEERPTFRASLLVRWSEAHPPLTPENLEEYKRAPWPQTKVQKVCHSYITDGQIQFLDDCTHALKGQTVPLGEP